MEDYRSNSNKDKAEPDTSTAKPEKKLASVVSGEVVLKERGLGSRFRGIFLGGDANSASSYVITEVLLPAARSLIVDVVSKGVERFVYGESSIRPRRSGSTQSRVQYNNPIYGRSHTPTRPMTTQRNPADRWMQQTKPFEDVIVTTREDADNVVENLIAGVDSYEVVSLADLYELLGLPSEHVDNKWGWTNMKNIEVRQVREGWKITFPPMEQIA